MNVKPRARGPGGEGEEAAHSLELGPQEVHGGSRTPGAGAGGREQRECSLLWLS